MAGRGSGIGLSASGTIGIPASRHDGGPGTNNMLPITQGNRAYGKMMADARNRITAGHTGMLWILVLAELGALVALRHGFRHYHGG